MAQSVSLIFGGVPGFDEGADTQGACRGADHLVNTAATFYSCQRRQLRPGCLDAASLRLTGACAVKPEGHIRKLAPKPVRSGSAKNFTDSLPVVPAARVAGNQIKETAKHVEPRAEGSRTPVQFRPPPPTRQKGNPAKGSTATGWPFFVTGAGVLAQTPAHSPARRH